MRLVGLETFGYSFVGHIYFIEPSKSCFSNRRSRICPSFSTMSSSSWLQVGLGSGKTNIFFDIKIVMSEKLRSKVFVAFPRSQLIQRSCVTPFLNKGDKRFGGTTKSLR
jgi:hypothetical protein